ncbi:hypothetical protein [Bradyrhizobium cenepequi]|uniref:hypothetical protein n=1 Tax=Bradyrhizobium cenepequi TaxID=2821403 RepID=UPI001CE232A9|nr:hypothetical protein [Bradyrhizobium cenepequi]
MPADLWRLDEIGRQRALRATLGLLNQNPRNDLEFGISAGGNLAEPPDWAFVQNGWF